MTTLTWTGVIWLWQSHLFPSRAGEASLVKGQATKTPKDCRIVKLVKRAVVEQILMPMSKGVAIERHAKTRTFGNRNHVAFLAERPTVDLAEDADLGGQRHCILLSRRSMASSSSAIRIALTVAISSLGSPRISLSSNLAEP